MKKLREKQKEKVKEVVEKCKQNGFAYLAMDTRTGKTCTALKAIDELADSALFATKINAISSIRSDCKQFGIQADIKVTNHEQMHKNKFFSEILVIDEAHKIGGFPKKYYLWNCFEAVAKKAKYVLLLSATPAPETWSTIFHQMHLVMWKEYKNFYRWADDYVNKVQKRVSGRYINDYSHAKQDKILQELDKYFVRCTQEEVGIRTKIEERFITATMSDYTKDIFYKIIRQRYLSGVRGTIEADTAAKLQGTVHQIASGSIITGEKNYLTHDKSKALRIKQEPFNKIVIFYKYKSELSIIQKVFGKVYLDSDEFQKAESGVFAGQFVSKREGVRLDTAEALFMFNIDFAYLSYKQTKDRIVSIDRTTPAVLVWVFSDLGFEDNIFKRLKKKKNYNSRFFRRDYL